VAWLETHTPSPNGDFWLLQTILPKEYAHLGIWFRVLEDALILLYEEIHAETAGYYDCRCSVAGKL
jgi:hypothetical protein